MVAWGGLLFSYRNLQIVKIGEERKFVKEKYIVYLPILYLVHKEMSKLRSELIFFYKKIELLF